MVQDLRDEGAEATGAEHDAPVGHRIEISTNYVSVVLDFPGATPETAYWMWKRALDALGQLRADEAIAPPRLEGGVAGFVVERAGPDERLVP
jgi:hypothetical protein